MILIVGTYSDAKDPGIYLYSFGEGERKFIPIGNIAGVENPSYLYVSQQTNTIYAIRENKKNSEGELSIYQLKNERSTAILSSRIHFKGAGSCYISIDAGKTHAFIANYGEGTVTVIRLPQEHSEGEIVQQLYFNGSGPDPQRQEQPHLHAAVLSKDERYLYSSDLGTDKLYRFIYRSSKDIPLEPGKPPYIQLPPGSGPRHLVFSPTGHWLYLITELSGEIFVFDVNKPGDTWIQQISIVRDGFRGEIAGGDIQVHPDGRFLYASNRGDANEIVVFKIDPLSGRLDFLQRISAAGVSPRNLLICEQQGLVLVANEQSNNIAVFKLQNNGSLEFTKQSLHVQAPACLKLI